MKLTLLMLFGLMLIIGCSSNQGLSAEEKNQAFQRYITLNNIESVNKVTTFKFRGWSSLTNKYLILSSSHKRQYLSELAGFCSEISWTHALLINRTTSSSLNARFDSISTLDEPRLKCMIKTIYPLTKQQKDEIIKITESEEKVLQSTNEPEKKSV
jgi:hypothetical protein